MAADAGDLAFGTVETFIWRLVAANIILPMLPTPLAPLVDIRSGDWDWIYATCLMPQAILPQIVDGTNINKTARRAGAAIVILAAIGDQQRRLSVSRFFGDIKTLWQSFCYLNTGTELVRSSNRLLTTIGLSLTGDIMRLRGQFYCSGRSAMAS